MMPKTEATDDLERVRRIVSQHHIGGLLFFNGGTAEAATESLAKIQVQTRTPLTIAADMERGLAQQVTDLTTWPHALAFDRLGTRASDEVEQFASLSATEARSIGVHISFSPVADIHRNPKNPIIANRAFGTAAERVAELASAYVRGCQSAGLLCCAKHFPGHGNTHDDSHATLPRVDDSREVLERTDLRPFRELVTAGVDTVMTAHVTYPALDPSGGPATLSTRILTDLLRDEWQFRGAIVTDSLKMDGVKAGGNSEGELAVSAIAAGVDLLLDVEDVEGVITAIEAAAARDEEFAQRVDSAFEQAWALKTKAHSTAAVERPDPETTYQHAYRIALGACQVVANDGRIELPIDPGKKVGFLLVNPLGDNAYTKTHHIMDRFQKLENVISAHVFGPGASEGCAEEVLTSLADCDVCVVSLVVKPAAWRKSSIADWQHHFLQLLCAKVPTVIAAMGIAELLEPYPDAALQIATFSDAPVCQEALVRLVMGEHQPA